MVDASMAPTRVLRDLFGQAPGPDGMRVAMPHCRRAGSLWDSNHHRCRSSVGSVFVDQATEGGVRRMGDGGVDRSRLLVGAGWQLVPGSVRVMCVVVRAFGMRPGHGADGSLVTGTSMLQALGIPDRALGGFAATTGFTAGSIDAIFARRRRPARTGHPLEESLTMPLRIGCMPTTSPAEPMSPRPSDVRAFAPPWSSAPGRHHRAARRPRCRRGRAEVPFRARRRGRR